MNAVALATEPELPLMEVLAEPRNRGKYYTVMIPFTQDRAVVQLVDVGGGDLIPVLTSGEIFLGREPASWERCVVTAAFNSFLQLYPVEL